MLAIVMRENMKLADNTLNNERLTFVNTKFLPKYWRIVALILFYFYFIIFPHTMNYKQNKNDNK